MKRLIYIWGTSILAFGLNSCSDLLDTVPSSSISSANMWGSENLADMGVLGVYNCLRYEYVAFNPNDFDALGVSTDARGNWSSTWPNLCGTATPNSAMFADCWKQHYEGIHRANDAIYNLPNVPGLSDSKRNRLMAESKFLRAFFYYRLNMLYRGVPLYLEPITSDECINARETESRIWEVVLNDLKDCIETMDLPDRYQAGDSEYGRVTKGAAYALRGKVYLWLKKYENAVADFKKVGDFGYSLFQGSHKELFKEANEQSEEMIFSLPCIDMVGYGNDLSFKMGTRNTRGSCWNDYYPSTDFIDTYEWKDGRPFDWNDVIPGYTQMKPTARSVYFLRDGMTEDEKTQMLKYGADMSKYLNEGNEKRILKAYKDRDPRLTAAVITPYSTYLGVLSGSDQIRTLRWPYRVDAKEPFDLRTDTNTKYHYLFRKFVGEGMSEMSARDRSPIDIPIIRYADVLLGLAEALNETGALDDAIQCVNKVRARAGVALLNSNEYTAVSGQDNLRERIRNEKRWEFIAEGVTYFDELRWGTWKEKKFPEGAGLKEIWGTLVGGNSQYHYLGDYVQVWAIPVTECQMNPNLVQNPGWMN